MSAAARGAAGTAAVAGPLLCIETSCDDTSAAVVRGREVLSSIVSSQNELHAQFGGVVPEVASRRHTELVNEVVAEALSEAGVGWDDLAGVATTQGPGLIGALLVGLAAAKAIAYRRRLPLVPVNHLQGHIAANYALGVEAPFVCLVASGGHTLLAVVERGVEYRVAARTMDDAAGEAFDKGARLLGLGYPGGRELDLLAATGDATLRGVPARRAARPRLQLQRPQDGAAVRPQGTRARRRSRRTAPTSPPPTRRPSSTSWSTRRWPARSAEGLRAVAVAGGVAANSGLRRALAERGEAEGLAVSLPPLRLCTDNAAMIGLAAGFLPAVPWPDYLALDAFASDAEAKAARPAKGPPRSRPRG